MRSDIIHGDCLRVMADLEAQSIDFILTDPPYLVNYRSRDGRRVLNDNCADWLSPAFAQMFRVLKEDAFCVSFYGWPSADLFLKAYRDAGFRVVGHLMFPKGYASQSCYVRFEHECAHLLVKGSPWRTDTAISDVLPWSYSGNRLHPTQKPIEALIPLIRQFSPEGGLVLDPFAGSASTLVAAHSIGRAAIGIELSAEYHAIAQERLSSLQH